MIDLLAAIGKEPETSTLRLVTCARYELCECEIERIFLHCSIAFEGGHSDAVRRPEGKTLPRARQSGHGRA
jgi:hypothetical protein